MKKFPPLWSKKIPKLDGWYWVKYTGKHGKRVCPCFVMWIGDQFVVRATGPDFSSNTYKYEGWDKNTKFGPLINVPEQDGQNLLPPAIQSELEWLRGIHKKFLALEGEIIMLRHLERAVRDGKPTGPALEVLSLMRTGQGKPPTLLFGQETLGL